MNPIPLPAGPFFCADEGRYLPGLTDLIVQAAAMVQRREIEEQLLKLRLKQKCFVALAQRAPGALVVRSEELGVRSSIKIFPGGSVGSGGFNIQSDSSSALSLKRPGPTTVQDETQTTNLNNRAASADSGASQQQRPTGFGVYPKGRW